MKLLINYIKINIILKLKNLMLKKKLFKIKKYQNFKMALKVEN